MNIYKQWIVGRIIYEIHSINQWKLYYLYCLYLFIIVYRISTNYRHHRYFCKRCPPSTSTLRLRQAIRYSTGLGRRMWRIAIHMMNLGGKRIPWSVGNILTFDPENAHQRYTDIYIFHIHIYIYLYTYIYPKLLNPGFSSGFILNIGFSRDH